MESIALGVILSFMLLCSMLLSEHKNRELIGVVGFVIVWGFIIVASVIGSGIYG